jgi:predicted nucleotidyltransferase component of viral defense system
MIERDEIQAKADEFGLHWSNVQRDYVFGWLIGGLFEVSSLADVVAPKGGNALRKAYFPSTRFSDDIDFTTTQGLDPDAVLRELNEVCRFAAARTGVTFDLERNQIVDTQLIDRGKRIYKLRLYFRDFSGNAAHIPLKVKVDVTEYDRVLLPVQTRRLIHQYSDASECSFDVRVVKLEEALADKMKCLIQRRYAYDPFDLVYGVFVNRELDVDRAELVQTFLRKTIFEPSPVAARDLLLGVPFDLMRGFWSKVVGPKASLFSFESAVSLLRDGLLSLFQPFLGRAPRRALLPGRVPQPDSPGRQQRDPAARHLRRHHPRRRALLAGLQAGQEQTGAGVLLRLRPQRRPHERTGHQVADTRRSAARREHRHHLRAALRRRAEQGR